MKQESTAPRHVSAQAVLNAIQLDWTRYDHPIIDGYNVYRRQTGQTYSATPYAQIATSAELYRHAGPGGASGFVYVA